MGIRGEVFSTKVSLQNRTYFFNVKENRLGDLYLNIVESRNRDEGGFERQSVILFAEDLQEFLQGFDESLRVMEKEVREKRRGKKTGIANRDHEPEFRERPRRDSEPGFRERPRRDSEPGFRERPRRDREPGFRERPRPEYDPDRRFSSGERKPRERTSRSGSKPRDRAFQSEGRPRDRSAPGERKPRGGGSRFSDRPFSKRSRQGNKDFNHRHEDKRDAPPRKRKVVVKKR